MGIKEKIRKVLNLRGGKLLFTVVIYLLFIPVCTVLATDESNSDRRPDIVGIKKAIADLSAPIDNVKINWVHNAIIQQEPEEQKQLVEDLNARLNEIFKANNSVLTAESSEQTFNLSQPQETPSFEELKLQIDFFKLGPDATVEDLIKKDKLVAAIAGIQDPNSRYELLEYLEAKERSQ